MNKLNKNVTYGRNSKHTIKIVSVTLLSIIALSVIVYAYVWQYNQINQLNSQIDDLSKQIDSKTTNSTQVTDNYLSMKSVSIEVFTPLKNAKVSSPLSITGSIPGNWSFEASFPIKLKNNSGAVIAQSTAHITGNWMTTDLVPFSAKLEWLSAESGTGTLEIQKDNPSGLAENDDSVSIPIKF